MKAQAPALERPGRALAASGRFKRFRPESEQLVREAIVKAEHDPRMRMISDTWHGIGDIIVFDAEDMYFQALGPIRGIACLKDEIERFSLIMGRFENEGTFDIKAGLFMSALINSSPDNGFTIHTAHIGQRIAYIGSYNKKDVIVKGPAGDLAGMDMAKGSLTILGDAGDKLGFSMNGGSIMLKGNASENAGGMMKGGSIRIMGNAGPDTGLFMDCGEISVEGELGLARAMSGGKIYHRGALVWPKEGKG